MKISATYKDEVLDFNYILQEASEQYEVVHHTQVCGYDFIYRPLGRKEYKKILNNPNVETDFEREDIICATCIIWPKEFDFDEVEAGVPTLLCQDILANSFLDSMGSTIRLLYHFREEMEEIDNQMACVISDAFPNYSLDEIESWDNLMFCKMYSRSEWKFANLRNAELIDIPGKLSEILELSEQGYSAEEIATIIAQDSDIATNDVQNQQSIPKAVQKQEHVDTNISKNGKKKLTPEELKKMQELQKAFPEINWAQDEILTRGADEAVKNADSISTVAPALRPGWGR